jgi:orotate phosphoribosyltransferase-like protein
MGFLVGLTMFLIFDTIKNMKQTHKTNTEKLEKILLLKEKGLTLREIGLLVGLTAEGVRYLINKFEIKKANA